MQEKELNTKLSVAERRKKIHDLIKKQGEVKISELSQYFTVTEMTVRRDLEFMEKDNLLRKTLGGAILLSSNDKPMEERSRTRIAEKLRIGRAAAKLVLPHEVIFIDSGTTTLQIVNHLQPEDVKMVVTNALNIAIELQNRNIPSLLIGGHIWGGSSSLVGPVAEECMSKIFVDRAFIAATGLTVQNGLSNSNLFEIPIKRTAINQANEVNLVIDSSKFGVTSMGTFAKFEHIDRIISDQYPDEAIIEQCRQHQVELLICE